MSRQLALPFSSIDTYDPADFLSGAGNAGALAWLADPAAWPGPRLSIFGAPGTGKTHLLHVFASRHAARLLAAADLRGLPPLPEAPALALDDADAAADPVALLHLINAAGERRVPLVLASRTPPARWSPTLPDLDSRLRAIVAVGLAEPDDAMLAALLARLLAARQLRVEPAVQAYLLARLPRSCAALREAAARLDQVSLAAGSRITRAVAAEILAGLDIASPDDECAAASASPSPDAARLL